MVLSELGSKLQGALAKLNRSMVVDDEAFNALLKEKTIVVPGIFFDLNPAKRRDLFDSPCHHFVRLSYGPKMDVLKQGLDGIERVIRRARGENIGPTLEDEVAIED